MLSIGSVLPYVGVRHSVAASMYTTTFHNNHRPPDIGGMRIIFYHHSPETWALFEGVERTRTRNPPTSPRQYCMPYEPHS
jgi:hypothetical protein